MRTVYVDYAATTPCDPRVLEAMKPYFLKIYGNASSINMFGLKAHNALDDARSTIAQFINAQFEEVIFTGSATEANNLALKGFSFNKGIKKTHIAISTIEHDCVLNTAQWLKKKGCKITYIPVDRFGLIDLEALEEALSQGVTLFSVIHANNEIGTIQPLEKIGALCHKYDAYIHTDAAQSLGKIPIDVKKMNIDLMTVNAHKVYGPKGVGALYIKKGIEIEPLLHGGGHEFGLRSSTENIAGIIGFAKAIDLRIREMELEAEKMVDISESLTKGVLKIPDTRLNGHPTRRLPNITNFSFAYIEGEALLLILNDEGIAASSGSACSSKSLDPSHVLLAIGLNPEEARGSLRLSLGKHNTLNDVEYILKVLPKAVEKLRKISPLTS